MLNVPRTFQDLHNYIVEQEAQDVIGMVTPIKLPQISPNTLSALVDSGNGAYNVIHGTGITRPKSTKGFSGGMVSFKTVEGKIKSFPVVEQIVIHIGSGEKETRPVIELDVIIDGKRYNDVKFSVADRSENEHPVLLGIEFIRDMGVLIDPHDDNPNDEGEGDDVDDPTWAFTKGQ